MMGGPRRRQRLPSLPAPMPGGPAQPVDRRRGTRARRTIPVGRRLRCTESSDMPRRIPKPPRRLCLAQTNGPRWYAASPGRPNGAWLVADDDLRAGAPRNTAPSPRCDHLAPHLLFFSLAVASLSIAVPVLYASSLPVTPYSLVANICLGPRVPAHPPLPPQAPTRGTCHGLRSLASKRHAGDDRDEHLVSLVSGPEGQTAGEAAPRLYPRPTRRFLPLSLRSPRERAQSRPDASTVQYLPPYLLRVPSPDLLGSLLYFALSWLAAGRLSVVGRRD